MESVELARQAAEALHTRAVEAGENPWKPYEFALAEAKRRGIDVESAAPGAAVLENAQAAFIPEDKLIIHENVGSRFEQAFLVAHEIGHAELGDDSDIGPATNIDPARPSEPSPIGLDRVVDYNRRQRREVQMDLFAREFLLPRTLVRKLHLEEKLTASAIAERLNAPFDVVAQQMLDGLLLPPVVIEAEAKKERALNPLQRDAAEHRGKAYLLEAGPGTGKTQTLTARVEGLLRDGVNPRRILVLTFSNKAAMEMAERIALKNKDAAASMWIGTFHAFGLDLIRRFHTELGLSNDPHLIDRTEAVEVLEEEFPRLGLAHYQNIYDPTQVISDILASISRAKDEVVDEKRYAELADEMGEKAVTPEAKEDAVRAKEVARVYEAYEMLKRESNRIDFGDLVSMPVRLLEQNATVRTLLQGLYDHVLVDEYQDVNRSSVRLLSALCGSGENLWAVGDAKQSIYRFRGASSFNMSRFGKNDFAGGVRGRLKRNYRSVTEVVELFSAFALRMKAADKASALESDRGALKAKPELQTVNQAEEQSVALADSIEEMRRGGHSYRDQAVLCTGNEKLSSLGHDLERLGLPVLFLGSLFERPEVKDLLALLTLLTDRRAVGLLRIGCLPEFRMTIGDVAAVIDHLRITHPPAGTCLREPQTIPGISDEGLNALHRLAGALQGFDRASQPWDVLSKVLLDRTQLAGEIGGSSAVKDRARGIAIWQLMNFVRVQPRGQGLPITRLLNRVRRLLRLGDDRDLRQLPAAAQRLDAVRLMTIHGSKGLEFPVVHLPGLNADSIPRNAPTPACPPPDGMVEGGQGSADQIFQSGHTEEQECLFYVALSRAKDRLFLYAPTKKSNDSNRAISPFVGHIDSHLTRRHVTPARTLPAEAEGTEVHISVSGGGLQFTNHQIGLFKSCPRRFLYTHIIQIGGLQRKTAFMQLHQSVRAVFQAVISGASKITNDTELVQKVEEALTAEGLAQHGYIDHYRTFAVTMLRYFLLIRENLTPNPPTALSLTFGDEEIVVTPDDMLARKDGVRVVRAIRTGYQKAGDLEDIGTGALLLAARNAFPDAIIELVSLSDQTLRSITLSPRQLENRSKKLKECLQEIRLGRFPAVPATMTCPGCPAFFVCGPTPLGVLAMKGKNSLPVAPGKSD